MLSTLVTLLILLAILIEIQGKGTANLKILSRLRVDSEASVAKDSVNERLRGILAAAMTAERAPAGSVSLAGQPSLLSEDRGNFRVTVQDVEGLIDLYLAPPEVLNLLPSGGDAILSGRASLEADFGVGARYPTIDSTIAQFGLLEKDIQPLVTQSASGAGIRVSNSPSAIATRGNILPPSMVFPGQTKRVRIDVAKQS